MYHITGWEHSRRNRGRVDNSTHCLCHRPVIRAMAAQYIQGFPEDVVITKAVESRECNYINTFPILNCCWVTKHQPLRYADETSVLEYFEHYTMTLLPITVAAWSKAWTLFARSNTGIVGSNPTRGLDVCVHSMFVLLCV
jgi:hypothetical protein